MSVDMNYESGAVFSTILMENAFLVKPAAFVSSAAILSSWQAVEHNISLTATVPPERPPRDRSQSATDYRNLPKDTDDLRPYVFG